MRPKGPLIVPHLHPAYLFRSPTYAFAAVEDWRKSARIQREGPTIVPPTWQDWQWQPTLANVQWFFRGVARCAGYDESAWGGPWSVDFEATLDGRPVCMGVWTCEGPTRAPGICVPFLRQGGEPYWAPGEDEVVMRLCRAFLESTTIEKVGHNITGYDFGYRPWNTRGLVKRAWGVDVEGILCDTMVAHHTAFAELRHSLSFCASVATDLGPYKLEVHAKDRKDDDELDEDDDDAEDWSTILERDDKVLRTYCLLDCFATAVVYNGLKREMAGRWAGEWRFQA